MRGVLKFFQEEFTWQPYRFRPLAIWAMRMNRAFEVKTLDGLLYGQAGDWLIRSDDGQEFPLPEPVFRRIVSRREWKGQTHETSQKDQDQHPQNAEQGVGSPDGVR